MAAAQLEAARAVQVGARNSWRILGKVVVAKRVFDAFRRKWQKKRTRRGSNLSACVGGPAAAGAVTAAPSSPNLNAANGASTSFDCGGGGGGPATGSAALMELGVTTGLTLVFALLKQNWAGAAAGGEAGQLSSEVLRSALTVIRSLPPLSLSPSVVAIPRVGQNSLEQITDFLARCARVSETGDEQGSRLCVEIMLCLAVLRGSLWHMLVWVGTCLGVLRDEGRSAKISADVVDVALEQIRKVTAHSRDDGRHVARYNLARSAAEVHGLVDLYEGVQCIMAELVEQSQSYTQSCTGSSCPASDAPAGSSAGGCGGRAAASQAYVWGSNSSRQLADSAQDKFLVPKLSAAFSDVQRMEASQFCTFVIHTDGKVTACGKGSYGRLELGESSSSSSSSGTKAVDIPGTVKMICSSGGSDGFALALTEDGTGFHCYDIQQSRGLLHRMIISISNLRRGDR